MFADVHPLILSLGWPGCSQSRTTCHVGGRQGSDILCLQNHLVSFANKYYNCVTIEFNQEQIKPNKS